MCKNIFFFLAGYEKSQQNVSLDFTALNNSVQCSDSKFPGHSQPIKKRAEFDIAGKNRRRVDFFILSITEVEFLKLHIEAVLKPIKTAYDYLGNGRFSIERFIKFCKKYS